jgi:RimJ/RimL family protein N-acetyltransferase
MILRAASPGEAAALAPYLAATHAVIDSGLLVGGLALTPVRPGTDEVSVWVRPEDRGRGVATWAVRTAAARATQRLEFITDVTDTIGQRIALNSGFTREAIRRGAGPRDGVRHDDVLWARLPEDPRDAAPRPLPELPGGELRDGDVLLRPIGPADLDDVFLLRNLPDVRTRAAHPRERPRAEIARRCALAASEWLAGDRAEFTIRVDGEFAGEIMLTNEAFSRQAMLGYAMLPAFRGRGVATRAVRLVSAWAFTIGVERLIAGTAPDNLASQRVLVRAGFTRESVERSRFAGADGGRVDNVTYVLFPAHDSSRRPGPRRSVRSRRPDRAGG